MGFEGPGCGEGGNGVFVRSIMLFGANSTVLLLGRTTIYVLKKYSNLNLAYIGAGATGAAGEIGENP